MSTLNVTTIQSNTAATPPVFRDSAGTQIGTLCRAWVNFNGSGTVAIRASFNVSSITDAGVGRYSLNFTEAFADVNYSILALCQSNSGIDFARVLYDGGPTTANSGLLLTTSGATNTYFDSLIVCASVFR